MRIRPTILSLACVILFTGLVFGQVDNKALQLKTKSFKNSKRFSVEYDKFKDETWVTAGPFLVSGTSRYMMTGSMIFLSGRFVFKGNTLRNPVETIYLTFTHKGKEWEFLTTKEVYILFDGERVMLPARQIGEVRRGVSEELNTAITPDVLLRVSHAKSAELKAGDYVTKLKEEHLQALRDLLSLSTMSQTNLDRMPQEQAENSAVCRLL